MTRAADEPLMTQALTENTVTEGFREVAPGQFARLKVYPICDRHNRCFAAAAFEDREADVVFWDATMDFLNGSKTDYASNSCYRRLSSIDGLVLVNARDGLILAANNAARHIYRVLGVGHLVGRRTSSEEINWNGIDNVLYTGTAEEQELQKKGLFLDFRFIPLHAAGSIERIIVVIEDVTQLKLKDEELRVKAGRPSPACCGWNSAGQPRKKQRSCCGIPSTGSAALRWYTSTCPGRERNWWTSTNWATACTARS